MWLVLCESGDADAQWAHRGLAVRASHPVELVTGDDLAGAWRWEHRLGAAGVSLRIDLSDGRVIRSDALSGVLNRLVAVPEQGLGGPDAEYATQERFAFFLSWLSGLACQVLNRPSPHGLSGRWLERGEWLVLAARAGLATPKYQSGRSDPAGRSLEEGGLRANGRASVIVVGRHAVGSQLPPAVVAGCGRLARSIEASILGVEFDLMDDGTPVFARSTTTPALRRGGDRLIEMLIRELTPSGAST